MLGFGKSSSAKFGMSSRSPSASRGMSDVALARVNPGQANAMRNAQRFEQRMGRGPAAKTANNAPAKAPMPQPAQTTTAKPMQPTVQPVAPVTPAPQEIAKPSMELPKQSMRPNRSMALRAETPANPQALNAQTMQTVEPKTKIVDHYIGGGPQKTVSAQDNRDSKPSANATKPDNAPSNDHLAAVQATSVAGLELAAALHGESMASPKPDTKAKPALTHAQAGGHKPQFAGIQGPSPFGHM